jgi:pimeloyl-ACP methyl ester carboxylesterase
MGRSVKRAGREASMPPAHPGRRARAAAEPKDWAFHASNSAVFEALAGRRHAASLREYFGARAYEELAELARRAKRARKSARVLIVPGMMGSRLCDLSRRGGSSRAAVLWIDPRRIGAGRLENLALHSRTSVRVRGILLASYARLKLELAIEGFDARFFAYDWRLGIEELGAALAAAMAAVKPAAVIAHSMGALVARIAAGRLPKRAVRRIILLGAPNLGSYAPVLALRGVYPFVQKLSRIDLKHTPDELSARIFSTFPGLYQMLPTREHSDLDFDLLDPGSWPDQGPRPDPALLGRVAAARAAMRDPDDRMVQIVGVNRDTVVGVGRAAQGFEYVSTRGGDGTVPVSMALLPGLETYYADELHGNLAGNPTIIRALVDLIREGRTRMLAPTFTPAACVPRRLDDARLREAELGKIDWRRLTSTQREAVMADLDGADEENCPDSAASLA